MVSVGASEDFLTSMMNKPKELEMGEKNRNPSVKYYSELSFLERRQKPGENLSFAIWTKKFENLSARCLPFYIFLTMFRVGSFSLVFVVCRFYSILIYMIWPFCPFLSLVFSSPFWQRGKVPKKVKTLKRHWKACIRPARSKVYFTSSCLFSGLFWTQVSLFCLHYFWILFMRRWHG